MDCKNNPCDFAVDMSGQRTNGRCRCWDSLPNMEPEVRVAMRRVTADLRAELARLTTERDAEKVMTDEMYRGQRAAQEAQAAATERARVAENERDAAQAAMIDGALREADLLARAERAERVAKRFTSVRQKIMEWHDLIESEQDLDDSAGDEISVRDVVLKEMKEACEGGRDGD